MLNQKILETCINQFLVLIKKDYTFEREAELMDMIEQLKASIPEKKRASFGIVSVIAAFCKYIFKELDDDDYKVCVKIYRESKNYSTICIGLGLLSHYGLDKPEMVLPILVEAADHELWEVKEFVQMFIRKITKKHKQLVQALLLDLTESKNKNLRRFASEATRPVAENRWIQEEPEFSLKILRKLFMESEEFPRVSVANNLSDLSRKNPELIYGLVKELKAFGNKDSDFIAYRACRNLIKEDTIRVMNLLEIDEYIYKNKRYYKKDYIDE